MMDFVLHVDMMMFVLKMMKFQFLAALCAVAIPMIAGEMMILALKLMNSLLTMMDFVLTTMDFH